MLCSVAGWSVVEALEGSRDVTIHGDVNVAVFVVPIEV